MTIRSQPLKTSNNLTLFYYCNQLELGEDGLQDEDKYLLEINLDDLTTISGETQTYCLLAIWEARDARVLREYESNTNAAGQTAWGDCRNILVSTKNIAYHEQDLKAFNSCCNPVAILVGEWQLSCGSGCDAVWFYTLDVWRLLIDWIGLGSILIST